MSHSDGNGATMSTEGFDSGEAETPCGIAVEVNDAQRSLQVNRETIAAIVRGALAAEGVCSAAISVVVVDDATIRELNRRHLGHDWPTDVISFVLSDGGDAVVQGELIVSTEMAVSTAEEAGVRASDELALYLVHGVLHLCGYDDVDAAGRDMMRRREGEILTSLGLPNTFPLVAVAAGPGGREGTR